MTTTERIDSFTASGLTFDVRDRGPLDGEVVVLLHGFPQRAACWAGVEVALHAQGYRTLAPDQRGYSRGARPRRRRDYQLPALAADVAALLEQVGPAHLVGHDWGSAVAWATAAEYPELVRTLTAVSVPHPRAFLSSMVRSGQLLKSWYMAFFQLPWLPERMLASPKSAHRALAHSGMTEEMVAAYADGMVADGALRGALNYYRAIPLSDFRRMPGRVTVPTTHVWSDDDIALGRTGADLTEKYVTADYRLEVLPGLSHWIPDEAPERLAAIIADRAATAP